MSSQWTATEPERLDRFLSDQNPSVSRSRIQKVIDRGEIEVNGEAVTKASLKLKEGDSVFFDGEWDEPTMSTTIEPVDLDLEILYEDDDAVVINKPAGYAVHPGHGMQEGEKTILHGIAYLFAERSLSFSEEGVLVHRLDKDTTGCLLIAKSTEAHRQFQEQFEHRDVKKLYLAIVAGVPDPATAVIDAPIGRNLTDRTKMSVMKTSVSREAKTTYRTLDSMNECALLECDLHTGRTHQVRVHLSSIGHPILGDATYGSSKSKELSDRFAVENLCLHAKKLTFLSLKEITEISVEAPLPAGFQNALRECGLE